jgi:hypothetical protein
LRAEPLVIFTQFLNVVVNSGRLSQDMLSSIVLFCEVESELLHEVEHEGVVLADPGGSAVDWALLRLCQPLEFGIWAVPGGFAEGQ